MPLDDSDGVAYSYFKGQPTVPALSADQNVQVALQGYILCLADQTTANSDVRDQMRGLAVRALVSDFVEKSNSDTNPKITKDEILRMAAIKLQGVAKQHVDELIRNAGEEIQKKIDADLSHYTNNMFDSPYIREKISTLSEKIGAVVDNPDNPETTKNLKKFYENYVKAISNAVPNGYKQNPAILAFIRNRLIEIGKNEITKLNPNSAIKAKLSELHANAANQFVVNADSLISQKREAQLASKKPAPSKISGGLLATVKAAPTVTAHHSATAPVVALHIAAKKVVPSPVSVAANTTNTQIAAAASLSALQGEIVPIAIGDRKPTANAHTANAHMKTHKITDEETAAKIASLLTGDHPHRNPPSLEALEKTIAASNEKAAIEANEKAFALAAKESAPPLNLPPPSRPLIADIGGIVEGLKDEALPERIAVGNPIPHENKHLARPDIRDGKA